MKGARGLSFIRLMVTPVHSTTRVQASVFYFDIFWHLSSILQCLQTTLVRPISFPPFRTKELSRPVADALFSYTVFRN